MAHTYGTSARLPATATVTTANPATVSLTCPAGTTVLWLGIVVSGTTARTGGAPTYNGIAMTQAGSNRNAGGTPETYVEQWYLLDPPTGSSYTISVPNSNTRSLTYSAATGAAGSGKWTLLDAQSGASGSSTNPAASITTTRVGDIVFAVCGNGANLWAPSARSGTQIHDWDAGTRGHGTQYVIVSGSGSQATNWTFGTSEDWAISNAAFRLMSGVRDAGTLTSTGILPAPIVTAVKKFQADQRLIGKATLHAPSVYVDKQVAADKLEAVVDIGSNVESSMGATLEQHLPQYVKAVQFAVSVTHELQPKVNQDALIAVAEQLAPSVDVIFRLHPTVNVDCLSGVAVLQDHAAGLGKITDIDEVLAAVAVQYEAEVPTSTNPTPQTVYPDCLVAVVDLGSHIETSNGTTMDQHVPFEVASVLYEPDPIRPMVVSLDTLTAVAELNDKETSAGVTIDADCLVSLAELNEPTQYTIIGKIAVDCLTGIADIGSHIESSLGATLEQHVPFSIVSEQKSFEIFVNTEYSSPITIDSGALVGVAELFGSHTSSDLTMSALESHESSSSLHEPTINVVYNPSWGEDVDADHLDAVASLHEPTVTTNSVAYPDSLSGVAELLSLASESGTSIGVNPDVLLAVGVQFDAAAEESTGATFSVDRLFVVAELLEQQPLFMDVSVSADELVGIGSVHAVAPQYDYTVLADLFEAAVELGAQSTDIGVGAVFSVDLLIATGGLQSPTINRAWNVYTTVDKLTGVATQYAVQVAVARDKTVAVDLLRGYGRTLDARMTILVTQFFEEIGRADIDFESIGRAFTSFKGVGRK